MNYINSEDLATCQVRLIVNGKPSPLVWFAQPALAPFILTPAYFFRCSRIVEDVIDPSHLGQHSSKAQRVAQ